MASNPHSAYPAGLRPQAEGKPWVIWLKQLGLVVLVGAIIGISFCGDCWKEPRNLIASLVYSILVCGAIWFPNGLVHSRLTHFGSWIETPWRRLIIAVVVTVLITVPVVLLVNLFFFKVYLGLSFEGLSRVIYNNVPMALMITFLIASILHGREFLLAYKEAELRAERLEKERMIARYDALRNQVNPHFLFNSLNALSTLVHKDADLSSRFIARLSKVYRYVLDTRSREVVALGEELDFVRAYAFLEAVRFGDKFRLQVEVDADAEQRYFVPPLALQLLVENALKHNEVSTANPLLVSIRQSGEYLSVHNTVRPKAGAEKASGLGLANLRARYAYLSDQPVAIDAAAGHFEVRIPLLRIRSSDESLAPAAG